ncbi:putative NAD binding Rossmann fold oxidoreductase [Lyophyllum shimeji]|uniref:D-xylose 1-dehydrogenase (NADP(+), D-xylono-1,5-lactone-forming) n=1 Tax=Lyophyllum shimeji TaxID=47721 RepID=A0A9P3PTW0_LYOSH|nr:putative NAD binding Rossmann fold oxidoreductase [Lyophyllum shimeji]
MALTLQALTFAHQFTTSWLHPAGKKTDRPLHIGVLSSATINAAAIIHPAETHADVLLYGIASRDARTARTHAQAYGFLKSYGSYDELLEDPVVDIVYISTPNGLHFEWAYKSLEAGKHVLLEKPFTSNATEAKKLTAKAEQSGKILMEAFHWQFHPAAHRFRQILEDGRYGKILSTHALMTSTPEVPSGDIRWQYDLAGGSLMDMTYVVSFTRYALQAGTPKEVLSAKARLSKHDPRIDEAMEAAMLFRTKEDYDVHSTVYTDMARGWKLYIIPRLWELPSVKVETETTTIYFYNAMMPHIYHYIAITDKATGRTTYEKQYKGGPQWKDTGETYWSTYRYQLEAFVDKVRGREPAHWVTNQDSILQMETIDEVYKKSGLPLRPTSLRAVE